MALRLTPNSRETSRYRKWYQIRYRLPMAMNLRLPDELAERLRALADETGRSQQVLVRTAVEQFLDQQELKHLNPWLRANLQPARMPPRSPAMPRRPVPPGWDSTAIVRDLRGSK